MLAKNIGSVDKVVRIVAGIVLLGLGIAGPLGWWGLLGLIPLGTALLNTCPLYTILGVNTCGTRRT